LDSLHLPAWLQQLPQQLHFGPPSLSAPPTQDIEMSEASPSPSPSGFATLPVKIHQESGLTPESEDTPPVGFAGQATDNAKFKLEAAQQAQHADLASARLAHAGHDGHELKEEEGEHMAGGVGAGVDEEREGNEGDDLDDETAEGQRLTRSRRGNAAGLYMLDHGSQLVPKKVQHLCMPKQLHCMFIMWSNKCILSTHACQSCIQPAITVNKHDGMAQKCFFLHRAALLCPLGMKDCIIEARRAYLGCLCVPCKSGIVALSCALSTVLRIALEDVAALLRNYRPAAPCINCSC